MFNLVEAKEFYNENFEKISKANTCVLTGNRSVLDSGLESVLEHINNLKSSIDDKWDDCLSTNFKSGLEILENNLKEIKTSVEGEFLEADNLYKDSYTLLVSLNGVIDNATNLERNEPDPYEDKYRVTKVVDGYTKIVTSSSYYSDHEKWVGEYNAVKNNCLDLIDKITTNINRLNEINGINFQSNTTNIQVSVTNLGNANLDYSSTPVSGFTESSGLSFEVTTGNQTYTLNDEDKRLLYAVVASEAAHNKDDALGVTSVILNRCETSGFGGNNPITIIKAKKQFEGYFGGSYKKYYNNLSLVPDEVIQAVDDCLNGTRNTNALFFRSNNSYTYSNNLITSNGNRYGKC